MNTPISHRITAALAAACATLALFEAVAQLGHPSAVDRTYAVVASSRAVGH